MKTRIAQIFLLAIAIFMLPPDRQFRWWHAPQVGIAMTIAMIAGGMRRED